MASFKIVQVSDLHLSRTHGFFNANWRTLLPRLEAAAPDLLVASGDLTIDGADKVDDLAWAVAELARIRFAPYVCLPGNHDVGDEIVDAKHDQGIDAVRRDRYVGAFGQDWWERRLGAWRLLGLNSQLFGSGVPAEADQWNWLESILNVDRAAPTGVFLHKPLFIATPNEPDRPGDATLTIPRRRLLDLLESCALRFVACGHLHQYRTARWDGVEHIWAPSTAFLIAQQFERATSALGYVLLELRDDGQYSQELVLAPELKAIDLDALTDAGRYRYLRDIPVAQVAEIMALQGIALVR